MELITTGIILLGALYMKATEPILPLAKRKRINFNLPLCDNLGTYLKGQIVTIRGTKTYINVETRYYNPDCV